MCGDLAAQLFNAAQERTVGGRTLPVSSGSHRCTAGDSSGGQQSGQEHHDTTHDILLLPAVTDCDDDSTL